MSEQMRKEFEAFAKPHTYSLKMIDGEYAAASTALLWQCWQASRQALVVELPRVTGDAVYDAQEVHEALDKAGVAYK
jgi:hypothetical protein